MQTDNRRLRVGRTALLWLALAGWGIPLTAVRAAQPGELFEWPLMGTEPAQTLRFHFCPAGTIRPGRPAREAGGSAASAVPPTALRGFYLGETEVTLAQFRAVLGEPGMAVLKQEAATFRAIPELLALVQKGEREPAFGVGLVGAVQFCLSVQVSADEARTKQATPSIEARRIRLPSHLEWQYGARAIADAGQQSRLPHFNREFLFDKLRDGTQQKCKEVWSKLGRTEPFVGSQEQMLNLTAAVDQVEQAKVKDILAEWFTNLLNVPPLTAGGVGTIRPVGMDKPNEWGVHDCHDNVTEWVIWAGTPESRDVLWQSLATKVAAKASLDGVSNLFLAGGSFRDGYEGQNALARFTLWGGPKLTEGIPQSFEYKSELVGDYSPGFRVLMERTIASDWLFALRRGLYVEGQWQPSAKTHLDESQRLLNELADANHPGVAAIELYRTLQAPDAGGGARAAQVFDRLAQAKPETPARAKPNLAALLADTPKPAATTEATPVSDDVLFWRTLSVVQSASPR